MNYTPYLKIKLYKIYWFLLEVKLIITGKSWFEYWDITDSGTKYIVKGYVDRKHHNYITENKYLK
jgi:hypothetical protein